MWKGGTIAALVGFTGLVIFYALVEIGADGEGLILIWALLLAALVAGPLVLVSTILSIFSKRLGYLGSIIFSVPFLLSGMALGILTLTSTSSISKALDGLSIVISLGMSFFLINPIVMLVSIAVLAVSHNRVLTKSTAISLILMSGYWILIALALLTGVISIGNE